LKDAPVIALDDCTSSLDIETERKIFKNIKQHCKEKTLLVASHRASAIKDADEILFFENGSIVERGTHEELMNLNGRYADIYNLQTDEEVYANE
ncbi:MAG: multidrug ABC transporter ATP-binding protein, partial [Mobilitalea sp.]